MNYFLFGFCLTLISTVLWPDLPGLVWLPGLFCLALLTCKRQPLISGSLFAVIYFSGYITLLFDLPIQTLADQNQYQQSGRVQVRGEIISLVSGEGDWIGANIRLIGPESYWPLRPGMRLSWPKPPYVKPGQVWLLEVKPKAITSVMNQGGFNQQKYFISRHIIAKGRVTEATLISDAPESVLAHLKTDISSMASGDILLALLLGDRSLVSDGRWQELRQTGTSHLIAISGLHLSVVSGWIYLLASLTLNRLLPSESRRNQVVAISLAACGAGVYAALAGFALPTTRALVMLLMVLLLMVSTRYASAWERLLYAMALVLLVDPVSPLGAGFWLSFSALTIILLALGAKAESPLDSKSGIKPLVLGFIRLQLLLSLGLGIVQALIFGSLSPYSMVVNLLMVPWFSLLVIPAALLGGIVAYLLALIGVDAVWPLFPAQWGLTPFTWLLEQSNSWPAVLLNVPGQWQWALPAIVCAAVIWWRAPGWRMLGFIPALPVVVAAVQWLLIQLTPQMQSSSSWQVHLLDVGQGLSVLVSRNDRFILYDTGAAYGDFTYAARTILPFIDDRGLNHLDYLVVSHGDNDHAGGADRILQRFPDASVISDSWPNAAINCRPQQLSWQYMDIDILGPSAPSDDNDGSCVLRISDGQFSVLLPGDIEAKAEASLLGAGVALSSSILVAPHHGSRTSSSREFIESVSPDIALFAAGYRNQYGFPKPDIVARYQQAGVRTLTSGELGQISFVIEPAEKNWRVFSYRADMAPFWYNRRFEFGVAKKGG